LPVHRNSTLSTRSVIQVSPATGFAGLGDARVSTQLGSAIAAVGGQKLDELAGCSDVRGIKDVSLIPGSIDQPGPLELR